MFTKKLDYNSSKYLQDVDTKLITDFRFLAMGKKIVLRLKNTNRSLTTNMVL
jgi:hypothetical protein